MRIARSLPAALLVLLLSSGGSLAGDIYTWKDSKGVVHYSDMKPEAENVKVLKGGTQQELAPPPAPSTKPEDAPSDAETAFRKRRAEAADAQAKAEKERQQTAALKENCEAARNQLNAMKNGERMARYNSAGEKEVMDDATREAEIARLERNLAGSCK